MGGPDCLQYGWGRVQALRKWFAGVERRRSIDYSRTGHSHLIRIYGLDGFTDSNIHLPAGVERVTSIDYSRTSPTLP